MVVGMRAVVIAGLLAAITAAQPDDKLYLSGGVFNAAGDLVLDKRLHFIGAGIHPDSSGVTAVTSVNLTGGGADLIITYHAPDLADWVR